MNRDAYLIDEDLNERKTRTRIKKEEEKQVLSSVINNQYGREFILMIRKLVSQSTPVSYGNSEKTHYLCGRHSLYSEIMNMLKTADFNGYLKILEYENELKEVSKKNG